MRCVPAGLCVDMSSLQTTAQASETHGALTVPVPELLYQPAQLDDWQLAFAWESVITLSESSSDITQPRVL